MPLEAMPNDTLMPIQLMTQRAAGAAAEWPQGGRVEGEVGRKIAIVEDELAIAWVLEEMAEDLGHSVVGIFSTGQAAIDELRGEAVDLVFMDINLGGGMDGIETAQKLRALQPTPVVFISGYADPATQARVGTFSGEALLIQKPVHIDVLKHAIRQVTDPAN